MVKKKRKKRKSGHKYSNAKKSQLAIPSTGIEETTNDKKMSQVILELAEPLLQECDTDAQQERIIRLSMLVWNASFASEDLREQTIRETIRKISHNSAEAQFITDVISYLFNRKERYFSHDKRIVTNYEISDLGNRLNLTVGYAPMKTS